jgi:hypothetical protein
MRLANLNPGYASCEMRIQTLGLICLDT